MLLALAGHEGHFSIGTPQVEQAEYMLKLAKEHRQFGFNLAPFRSFGKLISQPARELVGPANEEFVSWVA
jgi:hypothetical protein